MLGTLVGHGCRSCPCCLRDHVKGGEEEGAISWFAEGPSHATAKHFCQSLTLWQSSAKHILASSSPFWGLLWVDPILKEKKKLPALWLEEDLFHLSSAGAGMHQPRQRNEVSVAPRAGSLA